MRRLERALLTLAVAGLAACGGDDARQSPPAEAPAQPEGLSGSAPPATQGVPSVVALRPAGDGAVQPPAEAMRMDQLGLEFLPKQLLVRPGQALRFTNSESLAHNVHVSYMDNDSTVYLADMDPDDSLETALEREGGYDVTCDEHPGMRAFIYVTSAPYVAIAETDGSFLIPDVPPGSYVASVWSVSPELRGERTVEVSGDETDLDLTAVQSSTETQS